MILAPTVGAEFGGSSLPAGWTQNPNPWASGGTVSVSGGQMALEARSVATNATFGPGTSLEFVATFGAQPHQHFGFINSVDFNAPWIVVSTGTDGNGVFARSDANQTGVSLGTGLQGSAASLPRGVEGDCFRVLRGWRDRSGCHAALHDVRTAQRRWQ